MRLAKAKIHFIGIGGIGMAGLAELLHTMGAQVQGSDVAANEQTDHLQSLGIKVQIGHAAHNIGAAEVVVYTSAIGIENAEYREARRQKIPLIPRAEALAEILRLKRGIAIAGSHGKTTTTSMTAHLFMVAGLEPTLAVGGRLAWLGSPARLGEGEWMLAEADESDGSFLRLSPEIAVVTNIDNDHLDHFGSLENLKKAFREFALRVPFYGLVIVCGDDPLVRQSFEDFPKRLLTYGFGKDNDLVLTKVAGGYEARFEGKLLGTLSPQIPGAHNALNAAAAALCALEAGVDFESIEKGTKSFSGVDRRFQFKGESKKGVRIYDDYGHHPTEIRAVIAAVRERYPNKRINVLFQPHRYTRTLLCWDQFLECFEAADRVFVADIYAASEKPIAYIGSERLVKELKHGNKMYVQDHGQKFLKVFGEFSSQDVLLILGAGDIYKMASPLLNI